MTERALNEISLWRNARTVTVVIDGLRLNSNLLEEEWRRKTISIVENANLENLELDVYESNIGLTNHILRVQRKYLEKYPWAIWVEEDFNLDYESFSKSLKSVKIPSTPFLMCGNNQSNHSDQKDNLFTLFPPYWGQVLNMNLVEEIEKVWSDKKIKPEVAQETFSNLYDLNSFPKKILFLKQTQYWTNYFNWGVNSANRWDAIATYVLWKNHLYTRVTNNNLVKDFSHLDPRSMNVRHQSQEPQNHIIRTTPIFNNLICFLCEKRKSRVAFSTAELLHKSYNYRVNDKLKRLNPHV